VRIRLITYNIHKCIGGVDRACRPERIRDTLEPYDADLVLLQEVDEGARRSGRRRQVDLLGDLLGFRHRSFYPNVRVRGGGHYGNAILSRFPISDTRNIDLTFPRTKKRSVLHARFRIRRDRATRTLQVFNLHLGLSQRLRKKQLRRFLQSHPFVGINPRAPVVVAGDFNDVWGTLGTRLLVPVGFRGAPRPLRTFPAWAPIRALDSVYIRGNIELLDLFRPRRKVARMASDHLPLVADLRL
jgi:endonuclease/exonuclease/phosphatase family metal-dependent hydrolase